MYSKRTYEIVGLTSIHEGWIDFAYAMRYLKIVASCLYVLLCHFDSIIKIRVSPGCSYGDKEIISTFLISKIKQEMIMSGKTIKDIAYEYGFADQSSMGKFFYKMTGMSPRDFKKSQESK